MICKMIITIYIGEVPWGRCPSSNITIYEKFMRNAIARAKTFLHNKDRGTRLLDMVYFCPLFLGVGIAFVLPRTSSKINRVSFSL